MAHHYQVDGWEVLTGDPSNRWHTTTSQDALCTSQVQDRCCMEPCKPCKFAQHHLLQTCSSHLGTPQIRPSAGCNHWCNVMSANTSVNSPKLWHQYNFWIHPGDVITPIGVGKILSILAFVAGGRIGTERAVCGATRARSAHLASAKSVETIWAAWPQTMRKSIWAAKPSAALFCYTEANVANSWSRVDGPLDRWGWMPTRTGTCCNCYRWVKKSNPVLEAVAHGLPCQYAQLGLLRILLQASSISCSCLSTRWFQPNFPDYHVKEFHHLKCMYVCVCVKLINSTSCQFDHDLCLSSRAFSGIGCIDTSPRIESSPCHSQRACRHRVLQKHLTRHPRVQGVYFQLIIHMCHAQNMAYRPYGSIWGIVVPLLGILSM